MPGMDGLDLYPVDPGCRWVGFDHTRHDEVFFFVGWRGSRPLAEQEFLRAQRILPRWDDWRGAGCLVERGGHGINGALTVGTEDGNDMRFRQA